MIKAHFGDIREIIIEELKKAEHYIYVAVAWFTDEHIFSILRQKLNDNVVVKIVIVKDEINLNTGFNFDDLAENDGQLFWDQHHHKFCVIDGKTVITGSYNWTYAAKNRFGRENIIVIKDEDSLLKDFSQEFQMFLKKAERHIVKPKEIIIEKEKPIFVDRIVEDLIVDKNIKKASWFDTHQKRTDWWKTLNEQWKKIYLDSKLIKDRNKPTKEELQNIFNSHALVFSTELKNINDTLGLHNLSRLKLVKGLVLDDHSKRVLKQILPECRTIE